MSNIDVNSLCRLCLAKCTAESFNIFEDSSNLSVRIMACCSLEIQKTDALPKQICGDCRYQLNKTYIFRTKSRNAESKLKRYFRMKSAGKVCHVLDEEEEVDEYVDSLEYVKTYEQNEESMKLNDLQATIMKLNHNEQRLQTELENVKSLYEAQKVELVVRKVDKEDQDTEYYIEMLEDDEDTKYRRKSSEPMELVMDEEDKEEVIVPDDVPDDDEQITDETTETRYECDPEEYSAIEKAVRATLVAQKNCAVQTNFQMRLEKAGLSLTKAEVTTDDGNILFMEFNTETNREGKNGPAIKIFSCVECNLEFSKYSQYKRHINQHNEKGLPCKFCTTWWPTKTALERHERTHTGERPFKCETCNKSFVQKEVLKRHQLAHTGERPFSCLLGCENESFKTREQLKSHNNRCHVTNPTPEIHRCTLCPKYFCHSSGLSRHMVQHTGKTYDCKVCHKSYTDASTLRRHMISVHVGMEHKTT